MKKVLTTMALAVLCAAGINAQTGTTTTTTEKQTSTTTTTDKLDDNKHCLAKADDQTWSTLGLNQDQIRRVNELQVRYKKEKHMDRGTENTMRGTTDDRATQGTNATGTNATGTNTDRAANKTESTGRTSDQLGYDDTHKESMERELQTVLTTAQFDRYKEWCQDQDATRGDSNTDMDR